MNPFWRAYFAKGLVQPPTRVLNCGAWYWAKVWLKAKQQIQRHRASSSTSVFGNSVCKGHKDERAHEWAVAKGRRTCTPWTPENQWLEMWFISFWDGQFSGAMSVNFRECIDSEPFRSDDRSAKSWFLVRREDPPTWFLPWTRQCEHSFPFCFLNIHHLQNILEFMGLGWEYTVDTLDPPPYVPVANFISLYRFPPKHVIVLVVSLSSWLGG